MICNFSSIHLPEYATICHLNFQYFFICIEIICQAANPNRNMNFIVISLAHEMLNAKTMHTQIIKKKYIYGNTNSRTLFFIKIYCVKYSLKLSCDHLFFLCVFVCFFLYVSELLPLVLSALLFSLLLLHSILACMLDMFICHSFYS